jgi:hypothetical protein
MIRSIGIAGIAFGVLLSTGCAAQFKQQEQAAQQQPINCATAEGDLRVLNSEKANVAQQIAMGATAIAPAGIVLGILTGTEGTKISVAAGDYNDAIDKKIAQIKSTCGIQ